MNACYIHTLIGILATPSSSHSFFCSISREGRGSVSEQPIALAVVIPLYFQLQPDMVPKRSLIRCRQGDAEWCYRRVSVVFC